MIKNLVKKNRSYRRFQEGETIDRKILEELVDLARLVPNAANMQPLKYFISNTPKTNDKIFPHLSWAGYLTDWEGPEEGERPPAYIIILGDTDIKKVFGCDHGIAAQTILLGAVEKDLSGCIIGSINRKGLQKDLKIKTTLEVLLVIALGKANEKIVLESVQLDGSIEYWRDENDIHHVPKRKLKDIIVK